ncbi:Hypothetical protein PHPALM_16253 [Phytophthora palmivora]|uniref:Uncharacterized protein n=1 Tax=Phytophthora palmivora TaxID=4796 RepID=A0A2P4XQ52_9STRA|nr:Hypothetical protein PHPALM_16253 [Phytophthora palmivora]
MLNFYEGIKKNKLKSFPKKNPYFKLPLRCVVASPSGSGKSNTMLYMISLLNMCFTKIIICTKENESLYDQLKETIDGVEIFENANILSIKDYDNETSKLIIFDDLVLESRNVQARIGDFYIRGRKAGFSMCYRSQVYYDLNMIVREYEGDIDKDELIRIYKRATSEPLNTLMIDMVVW